MITLAIIAQSLMDTWHIVPRVLIIMFVSLFITGLFIELDLFKRIEFIGRPLAKLSHLPNESAVTFVTSFGSVLAGNTMLAQLYREKIMGKRETFLTALLNGVPVYIKESFTYQIPIIIPALGIKVGLIYFLSFLLSGIARLIFVISWGKIKLARLKVSHCGRHLLMSVDTTSRSGDVSHNVVVRTFQVRQKGGGKE